MNQLPLASGGVPLRQVLARDIRGVRPPDIRATSCTCNWRQVHRGDIYVAITGSEDDGHTGAAAAASRGAAAIICERQLPVFNVPQCVVEDSRVVYGELCHALVGKPAEQLKVIGVTGTHGKTTVARLLTAIFHAAGRLVGTLDSYGYWDGFEDHPPLGGSLSPPVLARSLAEMVVAGASHAVVEFSSRELAQQVPAGISLDGVCLTQFGSHHLDWHGSTANYHNAKRRILNYLHPDGVAILNADDPVSMKILDELARPVLTYGLHGASEITAQIVEQYINEQTFVLSAGDDSVGVRTEIVGDHHVYNCLAAATTALAYGIELTTIARGLEAVDRLPGRMERVMCGQDFAVLVDAACSPEGLRYCLRAARKSTTGRLICVFGASDDCDSVALPAIGRVLGAMADVSVITNAGPMPEGHHRTCMELRSGFADLRKARIILDRVKAIGWALGEARTGDTVVIAGTGEQPHTPLDPNGAQANDSDIARGIMNGTVAPSSLRLVA
ncbi:MAG TPA: UDP-N-acetylmuramyl-tripeptide synthetase [Lacipirellulaceae bacterium]|nr:UDP-N-acetylmuramyl-tripeptide synthetase [Lacipirellulaceae bacterium]